MTLPDVWDSPQNILVVLAHPDDPEFFCGATLARWARAGHRITYQLLTCGDKGFNDSTSAEMTPDALCAIRHEEQIAAAKVIGVEADAIHFMDCPDGYLVPDLDLRRDIVRVIRKFKPDILVTCDPQTLFTVYGINHPDHRAAGQATMDAVFPAAGNPVFFPELLIEGLPPHMPSEVWCSLTMQPNVVLDVTDMWPVKLEAILQHQSQVGDVDTFLERMRSRRTEDSTDEDPKYEERFRVVKYK
ncbi:MAG TPA: PIG-L deacetylase family protein [Anaerolineales bacterium]|jgi:LmbE family N-acetylglucosaminyl deacetylase|nr:PIG-L deacetylase family protein [Anaerolineales bacterium]